MKKNKKFIVLGILTCLMGIILIIFSSSRTSLIQNIGYRATHRWTIALVCLTAAPALAFFISAIIDGIIAMIGKKKEATQSAKLEAYKKQRAIDEQQEKAQLNVASQLNDTIIYEQLGKWMKEAWGQKYETSIPHNMETLLRQLETMNAHQSKLSQLLTSNGADFLTDTTDVLNNAEQDMLKKVRKVLNCFVVYDSNTPEDVKAMIELMDETVSFNATQLNNVKEFLFAITDYLNKQGDDETGMNKLELYKNTILDAIIEKE